MKIFRKWLDPRQFKRLVLSLRIKEMNFSLWLLEMKMAFLTRKIRASMKTLKLAAERHISNEQFVKEYETLTNLRQLIARNENGKGSVEHAVSIIITLDDHENGGIPLDETICKINELWCIENKRSENKQETTC